jgi:hypothetical protein
MAASIVRVASSARSSGGDLAGEGLARPSTLSYRLADCASAASISGSDLRPHRVEIREVTGGGLRRAAGRGTGERPTDEARRHDAGKGRGDAA